MKPASQNFVACWGLMILSTLSRQNGDLLWAVVFGVCSLACLLATLKESKDANA